MKRWFWSFGFVLMGLLVAVRLADPIATESPRMAYFDQLQKWQPRSSGQLPVRVVDIDETSLDAHGQWPWPRHKLADLVTRLQQAGTAVIVFDILFLEPDRQSPRQLLSQDEFSSILGDADLASLPDNDETFSDIMERNNVVLGVSGSSAPSENFPNKAGLVEIGLNPSGGFPVTQGFSKPVALLAEAATGLGSLNMSPYDTTERVRRVPMMWRDANGLVVPSLVVETLRVATGQQSIIAQGSADRPGITSAIRVGPFTIPTLEDGSLWVRFRPDAPSLYVSADDVLSQNPESLRSELEGSIVLIGTSAVGLSDIRTTATGEDVPGVSIHAQMIEQILQEAFIQRDDFIRGIEVVTFILLGCILTWIMYAAGPVISIATGAAIGGIIIFSSWTLFQRELILFDITFPLLGGFVFFSGLTSFQFLIADREKKMIKKSFSHYVSPEVLSEIEKSNHKISLGGEVREISVMFCDIRNFTALSETLEAKNMVALLNDLFTELSDAIMKERGTIDKYIGDSIMAFWNAPLDIEDHARRACEAALSMRDVLETINPKLGIQAGNEIEVAIGISIGSACVGNVGSRERFDYSAIGNVVNRAARIEASCRHVDYDILVSGDVRDAASDLAFLEAGTLSFKGVSQKLPVFAVVGTQELNNDPEFRDLQERHRELINELSKGSTPDPDYFATCRERAVVINPRLGPFYDRLLERSEDFYSEQPTTADRSVISATS